MKKYSIKNIFGSLILVLIFGHPVLLLGHPKEVHVEEIVSYEFHFHELSSIPFAIPTGPSGELFMLPLWAINIIKVVADGDPIEGIDFPGFLAQMQGARFLTNSDSYIYNIKPSHMMFGTLLPDGDFSIVRYDIPEISHELLIEYGAIDSDRRPLPFKGVIKATKYGSSKAKK